MRLRIAVLLTALVLPCLACNSVKNWKKELDREPVDRVVGSYAEASKTRPKVMMRDGDKLHGKLHTDDNVIAIDGQRSYFDVFVFAGQENETIELELNSYVQGLWASNDVAIFYPSLVILGPGQSVLAARPDTVTYESSFWRGNYFSAKLRRTLGRTGQYHVIIAADNRERNEPVRTYVLGKGSSFTGDLSYSPGYETDVKLAPRGEYTIEFRKRK